MQFLVLITVKHPILSIPTGAPQPTGERGAHFQYFLQHPGIQLDPTKGVPPVHYTPSRK